MSGSLRVARSAEQSTRQPRYGDLKLRVRGVGGKHHFISVHGATCSIGSDASCTIRVTGAGLDPVHCLVVRGPAGAVLRRWGNPARLNGRRFTDAQLCNGDRLALGALELEFDSVEPTRFAPAGTDRTSDRPAGQVQPEPPSAGPMSESALPAQRVLQLENARQIQRTRVRRLIEELRTSHRGFDELQGLAALQERQIKDLVARIEELQDQLNAALAEPPTPTPSGTVPLHEIDVAPSEDEPSPPNNTVQWTGAHDDIGDQLQISQDRREPWHAERERLQQQLEQERSEFEAQRQQWEDRRARCQREIVEVEQRLKDKAETLAIEREELADQRRQLEQEMTAFGQEVERFRSLPPAPPQPAIDQGGYADSCPVGNTVRWSPASDPASCPDVDEQPTTNVPSHTPSSHAASVADVLAHYQQAHAGPGAPELSELAGQNGSDARARGGAALTEVAGQGDDEESIEDYMARLLKRVHGEEQAVAAPMVEAPVPQPRTPRQPVTVEPVVPTSMEPSKFVPRHQAPERSTNLDAMRELANQTARQAIQSSDRRRTSTALRETVLLAVVALILGGILMYLGAGKMWISVFGAAICLLTAVVWYVKGVQLRKVVAEAGRGPDGESAEQFDDSADTEATTGDAD